MQSKEGTRFVIFYCDISEENPPIFGGINVTIRRRIAPQSILRRPGTRKLLNVSQIIVMKSSTSTAAFNTQLYSRRRLHSKKENTDFSRSSLPWLQLLSF